jgi:hypothetical protein
VTRPLRLQPGEACQPPPAVFGAIITGLTPGEMESALIHISCDHPEAFEEAMYEVQRIRDRRARLRADGAL